MRWCPKTQFLGLNEWRKGETIITYKNEKITAIGPTDFSAGDTLSTENYDVNYFYDEIKTTTFHEYVNNIATGKTKETSTTETFGPILLKSNDYTATLTQI